MSAPTQPADIDMCDVDMFLRGDQYKAWEVLRREAPVHWNERSWGPGFWNITKYEDVIHVGIDPITFISGEGIVLDNDGRRTAREKALAESGQGAVFEPRGQMMIMTDPPRHTLLRRMVNKAFTHKAVRRMEPHIRGLTTKILDDICERGECDFVMDVARLLPLEVICEMVGVPEGDWESMFEMTNQILAGDDPEFMPESDEPKPEDMQMAFDLFQYMQELAEDRRNNPRDDALTVLVHGEVDGQHLNDGEIFMFFLLLILAGNETTRQATAGGMFALIENPDQRQRLIDDRSLLPLTIEEIVRWVSPVTHFERLVTRDTEIRGQKIAKGEWVCLWYPSANRDEDIFESADRFDVGRTPNDHIAFGKGEHFCLGANLARLELRVMFEELMKRIPVMELAREPDRLRSNFINGIKRMPVTFAPSKKAAAA